ncbi:MAG: GNAT family N-acetyltransferase [Alphaproteobacteria bacterium]|nr:GNAT family N-acetyltransferase [Alphaproteobacteria bacterium]
MRWRTTGKDGRVIVVERARPADAADVLRVHRAVLQERRWFITEPDELTDTVEMKVAVIRELTGANNCCFLVARVDGALVGMVIVQGGRLRRMRHVGKLEIYVLHEARGIGVGRALMSACVDWATHNPVICKLGLNVFAHNERAIGLYKAFGFEREGYRPREYRLADGTWCDDVLMYRLCDTPPQEPWMAAFR